MRVHFQRAARRPIHANGDTVAALCVRIASALALGLQVVVSTQDATLARLRPERDELLEFGAAGRLASYSQDFPLMTN